MKDISLRSVRSHGTLNLWTQTRPGSCFGWWGRSKSSRHQGFAKKTAALKKHHRQKNKLKYDNLEVIKDCRNFPDLLWWHLYLLQICGKIGRFWKVSHQQKLPETPGDGTDPSDIFASPKDADVMGLRKRFWSSFFTISFNRRKKKHPLKGAWMDPE